MAKSFTKMENKQPDRATFIPSKTYRTLFPWASILACFDKVLPPADFIDKKSCPNCEISSEHLYWIHFYDLQDMWKGTDNRHGPLSICPNCKIQVQFIEVKD